MAHTPPYCAGDILFNGTHCGSKSIKYWIEQVQPMIWLCGHIHENNGVNKIGETWVINCACWYTDNLLKGWLIDTENLSDIKQIEL